MQQPKMCLGGSTITSPFGDPLLLKKFQKMLTFSRVLAHCEVYKLYHKEFCDTHLSLKHALIEVKFLNILRKVNEKELNKTHIIFVLFEFWRKKYLCSMYIGMYVGMHKNLDDVIIAS